MRAVLISIQPYWCCKIVQMLKFFELRKNAPNLKPPFKCYIYMTAAKRRGPLWEYDTAYTTPSGKIRDGSQKVIGEFICDAIEPVTQQNRRAISEASCVSLPDMHKYAGSRGIYGLKAWHISSLQIYDKPKVLSEFYAFKKCSSCKVSGYESSACIYDEDCMVPAVVTRPPQSWCYVEEQSA